VSSHEPKRNTKNSALKIGIFPPKLGRLKSMQNVHPTKKQPKQKFQHLTTKPIKKSSLSVIEPINVPTNFKKKKPNANIPNSSNRSMALGFTMPLTELSTRNLHAGQNAAGA
jgi:hypothetical protein